jgi:protein pelota
VEKKKIENDHVKIGAFNTLKIDVHQPFVLRKKVLDFVALDTLKKACDLRSSIDLVVMLMQECLENHFLVGKRINTMLKCILGF